VIPNIRSHHRAQCDNCKREVENYRNYPGWIRWATCSGVDEIIGGISLTISKPGGQLNQHWDSEQPADFCQIPCLVEYLEKGPLYQRLRNAV
jgi:hypothetical protein